MNRITQAVTMHYFQRNNTNKNYNIYYTFLKCEDKMINTEATSATQFFNIKYFPRLKYLYCHNINFPSHVENTLMIHPRTEFQSL